MTVTAPRQTPDAQRAHATFTALLWSLAHPGRRRTPPGPDPFLDVVQALLDLEVGAYSPDPSLGVALLERGAHFRPPEDADYLLYRVWTSEVLDDLAGAKVGTPLEPDDSATIFLPARVDAPDAQSWRLTGPGVQGTLDVRVAGIPEEFLALRAAVCRFPLGWDVFLLDGPQVLGLPRTTTIEVL
jgi:alpha-D-ribose 1-methylphosphonate 5-triphosphate synthase subunit PhnH